MFYRCSESYTMHMLICCVILSTFLGNRSLQSKFLIVKPVLSDHIKQDIFLAFQTGGYCCIIVVQKAPVEAFCATFIQQ